jgi:hypothetical protein
MPDGVAQAVPAAIANVDAQLARQDRRICDPASRGHLQFLHTPAASASNDGRGALHFGELSCIAVTVLHFGELSCIAVCRPALR